MEITDTRDRKEYRFSVFTATYNRGNMLQNVYDDLLNQTYRDFEWVIVNDGSTDNTDEVVRKFIEEKKLPILYIKKKNGGKHSAWRVATPLFHGIYEIGADDDDRLTHDMLEIFDRQWKVLENGGAKLYDSFWEIRARVQDENGKLVGPKFDSFFDSDYNEFCYKMGYGTLECDGCRKVSVLQNEAAVPADILFEHEITNYSECLRWSKAARKYKTRYIPDIVRIYVNTPFSLSKQKPNRKKFYTALVSSIYMVNEQEDLMMRYNKKSLLLNWLNIGYQNVRLKKMVLSPLHRFRDRLAVLCLLPIAAALYMIRK